MTQEYKTRLSNFEKKILNECVYFPVISYDIIAQMLMIYVKTRNKDKKRAKLINLDKRNELDNKSNKVKMRLQ